MPAPAGAVTAWERVKLARHAERPHTLDYLNALMTDWIELHGDRSFGDDLALIGGLASFEGQTVILGHQKGNDTKENITRNFGMARPEGYRKAERLMRHAEKFGFPVVTFIDTPGPNRHRLGGARSGDGDRRSLLTMADLACRRSPSLSARADRVARAIGVADRILMLENAIYAVASPEACAAILWKDSGRAAEAAETMRITAADLAGFGIVDEVIAEPVPAHEQPEAIRATGEAIARHLGELVGAYPRSDPGHRAIARRSPRSLPHRRLARDRARPNGLDVARCLLANPLPRRRDRSSHDAARR